MGTNPVETCSISKISKNVSCVFLKIRCSPLRTSQSLARVMFSFSTQIFLPRSYYIKNDIGIPTVGKGYLKVEELKIDVTRQT